MNHLTGEFLAVMDFLSLSYLVKGLSLIGGAIATEGGLMMP
jgi:hypothetical protein